MGNRYVLKRFDLEAERTMIANCYYEVMAINNESLGKRMRYEFEAAVSNGKDKYRGFDIVSAFLRPLMMPH